jgi:hypothetical protein
LRRYAHIFAAPQKVGQNLPLLKRILRLVDEVER